MKRAVWYLAAGAVAGFAGVLGLHGSAAPAGLRSARAPPRRAGRPVRLRVAASPVAGGRRRAGRAAASRAAGRAPPAPVVQYGYGRAGRRVTVSGSRITDVTVPGAADRRAVLPAAGRAGRSPCCSPRCWPRSARISGVSGATYTSEAYARRSRRRWTSCTSDERGQAGRLAHATPCRAGDGHRVLVRRRARAACPAPELRAASQAACAVLHHADACSAPGIRTAR